MMMYPSNRRPTNADFCLAPANPMMDPQIYHLALTTWPSTAATLIMASVLQTCEALESCSIMLTGGRSAALLYEAWAELPEFSQLRNVYFYFGDERCVTPDHLESNYGLAMRTLFKHGVPPTCKVTRMAAEQDDRDAAALAYEFELPDKLDILLLSMGEDGHIASLFPNNRTLLKAHRRVIPVTSPKPPIHRLTITPQLIQDARKVFVLALGKKKQAIYEDAQRNPADVDAIPARLLLNRTWILGD